MQPVHQVHAEVHVEAIVIEVTMENAKVLVLIAESDIDAASIRDVHRGNFLVRTAGASYRGLSGDEQQAKCTGTVKQDLTHSNSLPARELSGSVPSGGRSGQPADFSPTFPALC